MKIRRLVITEVVVPAREGAINSEALDRPLHRIASNRGPAWAVQFDTLPKIVLEAELDDDIIALGECHRGHTWETVLAIASRAVGSKPDAHGWAELNVPRSPERTGFECLFWDARAKVHRMRLVDLLGGLARDAVPVTAWTGHRTIDEIGVLGKRFEEMGYTHLKLKCDLEDDVVALCDELAGNAPTLRVTLDPNERWLHPHEAKNRISRLAQIGNVHCIEDPIPRWMIDDYTSLRLVSPLPLALHVAMPLVSEGHMMSDVIRFIGRQAVDAFNFTAGPSEFMQLAHVAGAAGKPFWLGSQIDLGILEALYVHMAAAVPGWLWPSDIFGRLIRSHDLLQTPLNLEPPNLTVPDGFGLGVQLDEDALLRHATRKEIVQA